MITKGAVYTYKDKVYIIDDIGMMKCTKTREWLRCVIYKQVNYSETFIRCAKDFVDKFNFVANYNISGKLSNP